MLLVFPDTFPQLPLCVEQKTHACFIGYKCRGIILSGICLNEIVASHFSYERCSRLTGTSVRKQPPNECRMIKFAKDVDVTFLRYPAPTMTYIRHLRSSSNCLCSEHGVSRREEAAI